MKAVPILIRRISESLQPPVQVFVPQPVRTSKSSLLKEGELERAIRLADGKAGPQAGVLVLVDADEDCPAELGPKLLERARRATGRPVRVVLAKAEFENWFLAAAPSLSGRRGLASDLNAPATPEGVRGAKEWIGDRMAGSRRYSETLDQPALAAIFSLEEARASRSFEKCLRDVIALIEEVSVP